jgi:hypothetical protein
MDETKSIDWGWAASLLKLKKAVSIRWRPPDTIARAPISGAMSGHKSMGTIEVRYSDGTTAPEASSDNGS